MQGDGSLARDDSFGACKQRCLERLAQRYSGLSLSDEQRRLRIHLRRVLLEHDAAGGGDDGALGRRQSPPSSMEIDAWRCHVTQRIAALERRHRSATFIQQWWRRRREKSTRCRLETELPSSSRFVPVAPRAPPQLQQHYHQQRSTNASCVIASDSETTPPPSPSHNPSPSHTHAIVVELLGARDLLQSASDHTTTQGFVSATLRLVRESDAQELGRLSAERVPYQDAVSWEHHELRVSLSCASVSPSDLLRQTAVHVEIVRHRGASASSLLQDDAAPLGRLTIALDLLETPLAERYAMTRWFPLERRQRVGPARGEVRLAVRFLARHPSTRVWGAFACSTASSSSPVAPATAAGTSFSSATVAPSASKRPPLSPRRRDTTAPALTSPPKRLARRRSPPKRVGRPEAMSPPSSPSSYSSVDNNDRESDGAWSPQRMTSPSVSPERPRSSTTGIVSPSAQAKPRRLSVPTATSGSGSPTAAAATSPDDQKKPFLKRKPYQVVFRKLDWSRVGAKTDSNWGRATTAKLSPKNVTTTTMTTSTAATRDTTPSPTTSTGVRDKALDAIHAQRLAALTSAVHAVCRMSESSKAALALMKYRGERKTYLLPPSVDADGARLPASLEQSYLRSEDALQSLWRRLQSDDDGSVYAAMLQELPSVAMSPSPS
ncbi:hypothetical protein PINS_up005304 [Pythium insidiosum]|nr:hypothetical protein PINS_up005304 [Pythium insidiosum]